MDFTVARLRDGQWVHVYPEGRVNDNGAEQPLLPLRWGVGRLVTECQDERPIVIPIYHMGMDKVLPNVKPYVPRLFQRVTVCVGEPIDMDEVLRKTEGLDVEERRKAITEEVEEALRRLRKETEIHHAKHVFRNEDRSAL